MNEACIFVLRQRACLRATVVWTSPSKPKHPDQSIERQAQGPDVFARPIGRVLIRANDTEDQEGGTARPAKPLLPVALVECVGRRLKAFLQAIDLLQHRLAGRAPKDTLVDPET